MGKAKSAYESAYWIGLHWEEDKVIDRIEMLCARAERARAGGEHQKAILNMIEGYEKGLQEQLGG